MAGKNTSVAVGIPTYESAESLVKTVETIREQTINSQISEILIVVDGKKMPDAIKDKLALPKVRVVQRNKQMGQSRRLSDIFSLSKADLLVVTNDDVLLDKGAVKAFVDAYEKTNADLFSGSVTPLFGRTFFRHILSIGYDINKTLMRLLRWKTYLTTNGRLIALSRELYRSVVVPEKLQNNDAFLYLFARVNGFKHVHVPKAEVYFHSPKNMDEHMKQSSKFQRSFRENQQFFREDLSRFYQVPKLVVLYALLLVLMRKPILTTCYIGILGLSRIASEKRTLPQSGVWETDQSTKRE